MNIERPVRSRLRAALARPAVAIVVTVGIAVTASPIAGAPATAQEARPAIQIAGVEHEASGLVIASVSTSQASALLGDVTAVVDGIPTEARTVEVERRPAASVAIAIDTSGSMAGGPLVSAQEAVRVLVDRLGADDRVAIIPFATRPLVASPFTEDRVLSLAVIAGLGAGGETALYDAVRSATALLGNEPVSSPRALVLLSDGRDSGVSSATRESTIAAAAASGAEVHVFGLGSDVDAEYLAALSELSGGSYSSVATEQALTPLFDALGTRLGATHTVAIPVPPLPLGEHELELRVRSNGEIETAQRSFMVRNEGLLELAEPVDAGPSTIALSIGSKVPLSSLQLEAEIEGVSLGVDVTGGQVLVNSWEHPAGAHSLVLSAESRGALAGTTVSQVIVPALTPELSARIEDSGGLATLVVEARVQATPSGALRVTANGADLAPTGANTWTRTLDGVDVIAGTLSVELSASAAGSGAALKTVSIDDPRSIPATSAGDGGVGTTLWLIGGGAVATIAAAVLWVMSRSRRERGGPRPDATPPPLRRRRRSTKQSGQTGTPLALLIRHGDGSSQQYAMDGRPVTVGRAATCDVVVPSASVAPVEMRLTPRGNGEIQVHSLPGSFDVTSPGRWSVIRIGDALRIGDCALSVAELHEVTEATTGASATEGDAA